MRRQFTVGVPLLLAMLALSFLFNFSFTNAETAVSAHIYKPVAAFLDSTSGIQTEVSAKPAVSTEAVRSGFIPPYDMPVVTRPENEGPPAWLADRPPERPLHPEIATIPTKINAPVPIRQPAKTQWSPSAAVLRETAVVESVTAVQSPLAVSALYTLTLQPLHRNSDGSGLSSTFVFTNTGSANMDYFLAFYWQNGDSVAGDGPINLNPGESHTYNMDNAVLGETTFYGYVEVTGDEPLAGVITTPDYGLVTGVIYEDDGVTPISVNDVTISTWPNNDWYGGTYNLSDGSYYIGGLPDTDYTLSVSPGYPWARQWYSGRTQHSDADVFHVGLGDTYIADIILQPGGLITGTVYADDGVTPLENINVDLEQGGFGTCTDANGRYTIQGVPYGDQIVRAGDDWNWCLDQDSVYMTEYYLETNDFNQAAAITVNSSTDIITGINFTMDEGGTIIGQVTNSQSGLPLDGINISASEYDDGNYWRSATTDAAGTYTITGLIDADYRIRMDDWDAMQAGWAQQYYDNHFAHHLADRVTIGSANVVNNIDFALQPGGIITGVVTDQDTGLPVANVNVEANLINNGGGVGTCTEADGSFVLVGMVYGDYTVVVARDWNYCQDQPNSYATEYYDEETNQDQATPATVNGVPNTDINFTLEPGATINGRVTDASTGLGLTDVRVNIHEYDSGRHVSGWDTDASGYYTVTGLAAGDYRVAVDDTYQIPDGYALQYYDQTPNHDAATRITLTTGGSISNINFPLEPGGVITGYVLDDGGQPVVNLNVDFHIQNGDWGHGTCTDANGYYEMRALPYGSYRASAGGNWNHCQDQLGTYVQQFFDHQTDWNAADILTLNNSNTLITDVDFDLETGGYITGHVEDDSGSPLPDLHVAAIRASDNYWLFGNNTDSNGDYILGPLAADDYLVFACADCNGQLLVNEYYDDVYHRQDATAVPVTNGATIPNIDFVLDPGVWLTGHVSVPGGYDDEGLQIDVWQTIDQSYNGGGQTDSNGDYIIPVPPIYDSYWAVAARPWGTDLGSQWAHDFDIGEQTNWDFDLTLGGSITGCITDGGTPVPDIWVNADAPVMGQGERTGADGCYAITNLAPAEYKVRVEGWESDHIEMFYNGHNWDWVQPVVLRAGEVLGGIDIEAPLAGQIEGHVYETDGITPIEGVRVDAIGDFGIWSGWSQPDGYYTIDVPVSDYKLYFQSDDFWETVRSYYPDATTYASAGVVSVVPLPTATTADMQMERFGSLEGQVTDLNNGLPLEGIHVVAKNVDPTVNREDATWGDCSDNDGNYTIDKVFPGQTEVIAIGTCSNYDYGMVTATYTAVSNQHDVVNLAIEATYPERPFTVRVPQSFDYTLLSSGNGTSVEDADLILPALYAPLVQLDDKGQWFSELLTQVPTEANGGVAIINEQLVVTYTLESGLLWSDGTPLTSADIRFTWEMLSQPYPGYEGYVSADVNKRIENVTTPDGLTAVVTYEHRYTPPAYLGAFTYLMPEHILSGEYPQDVRWNSNYAHYPVGNGPYMVVDWVPGSHLDLIANPNYHKRSSGFPIINKLRFLFTEHPFWALMGAADVSLLVSDMPPNFDTFDLAIHANSYSGFDAIYPNNERPFFADAQVRQALYHALDREQFVADQGPDRIVGDVWLPPDHHMFTDTITTYPYNLVTAANLLDAAGWIDSNSDGIRDKGGVEFVFDLYYPEGNSHRQQLASDFQTDLASLGIDANVISIPWGDMWDNVRRGQLDAWMSGWGFDNRFDPYISWLLHSDAIPSPYTNHDGNNNARWDDPVNDALLDAATAELDAETLRDLYQQEVAYFSEQVPFWVTSHWLQYNMAVPTLLNFQPSTFTPSTWNIDKWQLPANPYDVSVYKSLAANSVAPQPGSTITYEVTVRNTGFFTTTNVNLLDTLPANVIYQGASPPPDSVTSNILEWNLGDMVNGDVEVIQIGVEIPSAVTHGTPLTNVATVYADQTDSRPGNNGYTHVIKVREDVDLALTKSGVGQPAIGEDFQYFLDYANWGGAPANNVVISDTLPPEVNFLSANPAPDTTIGNLLVWNVGSLVGNQWGGQIEITAEITNTGTVVNTAEVNFPGVDVDLGNNSDDHSEEVDAILPPLITQPTQGTTDTTPTVMGQAPASAIVDLYDISTAIPTFIMSTTASATGSWSLAPMFAPGSYSLAATATKAGLTSGYSNTASITVDNALDLDPDFVRISSGGVDIAAGVVRAERRTLAFRRLDIEAVIDCTPMLTSTNLFVTENGLFNYTQAPVAITDLGGSQWQVDFRFWLSDPHSTYDIWLEWSCNGTDYRENLLFILIDPDGYVYNQSLVAGGSTITDSLVLNAVVTAFVKVNDTWQVWPAHVYGQTNPQLTDSTTDDGVLESGYYSFLTPPGQYRIKVSADGFQPYQSPVLTVIQDPIHLDIGLKPVTGSDSQTQAPVNLSRSGKWVDRTTGWIGDVLTYDIWLFNDGSVSTQNPLEVVDMIPNQTTYVAGSLSLEEGGGTVVYDTGDGTITWSGTLAEETAVHYSYQVTVSSVSGAPFDIINTSATNGYLLDMYTLPSLTAVTTIQTVGDERVYLPMIIK